MNTMNRAAGLGVSLACLVLVTAWAVSASAQTVEDAVAAYDRGDYAVAYRSFLTNAEQGSAFAQFFLGVM